MIWVILLNYFNNPFNINCFHAVVVHWNHKGNRFPLEDVMTSRNPLQYKPPFGKQLANIVERGVVRAAF